MNLQLQAAKNSLALAKEIISQRALTGAAQISAAEQDVQAAREKLTQQQQEVEVLSAELLQKTYEWEQVEKLLPKGLVSELEHTEARNSLEQAKSKLNKGRAAVKEFESALSAKINELQAKTEEVNVKNSEARTKAQEEEGKVASKEKELLEVNIKLGSLGRLRITSPVDGALHEIDGIEGSMTVKKGDPLFTVVPQATEMAVLLSVAGRDMPLVQEGDKVRLQFQGWPAVQFVGWPSVAVGTFGGKIASLSQQTIQRETFLFWLCQIQRSPLGQITDIYVRACAPAVGYC